MMQNERDLLYEMLSTPVTYAYGWLGLQYPDEPEEPVPLRQESSPGPLRDRPLVGADKQVSEGMLLPPGVQARLARCRRE